jgi:hypothetical protein
MHNRISEGYVIDAIVADAPDDQPKSRCLDTFEKHVFRIILGK